MDSPLSTNTNTNTSTTKDDDSFYCSYNSIMNHELPFDLIQALQYKNDKTIFIALNQNKNNTKKNVFKVLFEVIKYKENNYIIFKNLLQSCNLLPMQQKIKVHHIMMLVQVAVKYLAIEILTFFKHESVSLKVESNFFLSFFATPSNQDTLHVLHLIAKDNISQQYYDELYFLSMACIELIDYALVKFMLQYIKEESKLNIYAQKALIENTLQITDDRLTIQQPPLFETDLINLLKIRFYLMFCLAEITYNEY